MTSTVPASPELNRLLGQTMGTAVRTPLHSLLGFLELLAASDVDADQRLLVDRLVGSAEELLSASSRMTWLLRLSAGDATRRDQRVELADVLAELDEAAGTRVRAVVAATAPESLVTDASALHQLLAELLSNAAIHGEAPVTLDVTPVGSELRFTVSDAGPGLPAAARAVLVGEDPKQASAVGLLLVRQLGALLDASIAVDANRVAVTLPLAARPAAPLRATPAVAKDDRTADRALKVLYVEDNATNRLLTQRQLARLGHELVAVATGEAGVEAALAGGFDVVLMDRHLPDIDGCEATRRIRAATAPDAPRLPILAVTADVTDESITACLASGMDEVLTKPVDLTSLGAALTRAAAGHEAQEAGSRCAPAPAVLRRIAERLDGDAAATADVVSTYLAELPGRRLKIQASVRRQEPRALLAAAESLRTSSEWLGASAVAGSCAALSAAAQAEALDTARAFLPRLLLHCEQLQEELLPFTDAGLVRAALARG
ncbi:response regulator [Motilibacter deserti]|uniref:Response regulator n=1 Tax=Motilibacter deserti TaxID=2714956 RepID=A0ABX0H2C6_9ACTN|nr:response regulator [Motilibacter deserti]NHC15887.1 response regulator [Motilibacter deserti]